jgi:hemolysin activation/secretion protein
MRHTQLALFICTALSSGANAQTIPDAGSLLRQIEQNTRQSQMQLNWQKRDALPPAMVIHADTLIRVQRFKFSGNKILPEEQLQAVAAPFADRSLNSTDLQQLTRAISEAYHQTGWLVQAYIPRQALNPQELTIQVIETIPPSKPTQ